MKTVVYAVILGILWMATAQASEFTLDGAFDYETTETSALFWPDPNGGVGVLVVSNSAIAEETEDNIAIGPKVEFLIDPILKGAFGTILPWVDIPDNIPVKFYGFAALTWELDGEHSMAGRLGTKACLLPDRMIQPTFITEYVMPEGGAAEEQELRALFGVTIRF